jgi:hypothetical protein
MILDPSDPAVADWLRRHGQPCAPSPAQAKAPATRWTLHAEDRQEAQREEWRRHKRASRARKASRLAATKPYTENHTTDHTQATPRKERP